MVLRHIRFRDDQDNFLLNQSANASEIVRRALDVYIQIKNDQNVANSQSKKGGSKNG